MMVDDGSSGQGRYVLVLLVLAVEVLAVSMSVVCSVPQRPQRLVQTTPQRLVQTTPHVPVCLTPTSTLPLAYTLQNNTMHLGGDKIIRGNGTR
jgi:hypothetical protein